MLYVSVVVYTGGEVCKGEEMTRCIGGVERRVRVNASNASNGPDPASNSSDVGMKIHGATTLLHSIHSAYPGTCWIGFLTGGLGSGLGLERERRFCLRMGVKKEKKNNQASCVCDRTGTDL